ncbi:MAG TPA: PEP/pyruvate-binding domain-containing protein [Planctomycetota bacterium]|nr:PEP/pyruvate-binding domain-containing protein [Planctomycetota bacterium]
MRVKRKAVLSKAIAGQSIFLAAAFQILVASPLWAIPSPDLIINFVASAAQMLGLLTVVAGSFAFSGRRKARAAGLGASTGWRWPFRIALAAFIVSLCTNVFQYSQRTDERNRRLQTNLWRSSTEEGKKVGDVNLKTLSVSDQEKHPLALSSDQVLRAIDEKQPLNLIDVREPEEVEMGSIPGTWHRRYPDLLKDPTNLVVDGKQTILFCESGNRSSEIATKFSADGKVCHFMLGGYEKWLAEGRPLVNVKERTSGEIRDVADYPNKHRLLDTDEVMDLIEKENVLFVDVRYPGEFETSHLPGAKNITMRMMPSDELWPELKGLEKRPIVAPCYDKRSSFFSMLLGLRLHRLGYDFRGRYTVPHEFAAPVKDKVWVAQWRETQKGKTLLGMASLPFRASLDWIQTRTGSLALAIVSIVLLLRLLLLPLTSKAERDQIVQKRLAPELKALRAKIGGDPQRLSRATFAIFRREGLTLGRNLAGTIAQLLLFIVFFTVVNAAATGSTEGFLWIPALGGADPLYVLPALIGALIFVQLTLTSSRRTAGSFLLGAGAAVLLVLLTFKLKAAVNLYLVLNLALLLVQSQLTRRFLAGRARRGSTSAMVASRAKVVDSVPVRRGQDSGIIELEKAHGVPGSGNKAIRLSRLIENGLPVPRGFVVTDAAFVRGSGKLLLAARDRRRLSRAWKDLRASRVAVRSSGLNEDGSEKSYAGVFESILNVSWERLSLSLEEVHASLSSARASTYGGNESERGGILVQKMVPAEYAGVLFTEHPASTGSVLVELVPGLGDALVSGTATPKSYRFGRITGSLLDAEAPPIDLAPLLLLGQKVEKVFGQPQDIEWAYYNGSFHVLQARNITTSAARGKERAEHFEAERQRILEIAARSRSLPDAPKVTKDDPIFTQNEMSELLPRPTPLSLSVLEAVWGPGGSADLACRSLGIPYDMEEDGLPSITTLFGALYVNDVEARRRTRRPPGALTAFRLSRAAGALEAELNDYLKSSGREMYLREALDFSRIPAPEMLSLFRDWTGRFLGETYVLAERINLAADFYLKAAKREIEKRCLDVASHLGHLGETVVHRAMSILPEIRSGRKTVADFLAVYGHRAPRDYELADPRYAEDPSLVEELTARATLPSPAPQELSPPEEAATSRIFDLALSRCRKFQVLKEEAKHQTLREFATLRAVLVALGERLSLGDGIFFLRLEEVFQLGNPSFLEQAADRIACRRAEAEKWKEIELPTRVSASSLETMSIEGADRLGGGPSEPEGEFNLRGLRVAGAKEAVGLVRIMHSPDDIHLFQRGEVLVARFTDPSWMPLFPLAGGVITEVGGWLSHAAIVAREYNLTAVVGVGGALTSLRTGDRVRLCLDGSIEKLPENRRTHDRRSMSGQVALWRQGTVLSAILRNLSRTGALIEVDGEVEAGTRFSLKFLGHGAVEAEVVRKEPSGAYALHFTGEFAGPFPDALEGDAPDWSSSRS